MPDTESQAHSSVLAAQSLYFSKTLLGKYTGQDGKSVVAPFVEGENREFYCLEGSVQAFARLLRYMYIRSYSDEADVELTAPGTFQAGWQLFRH